MITNIHEGYNNPDTISEDRQIIVMKDHYSKLIEDNKRTVRENNGTVEVKQGQNKVWSGSIREFATWIYWQEFNGYS